MTTTRTGGRRRLERWGFRLLILLFIGAVAWTSVDIPALLGVWGAKTASSAPKVPSAEQSMLDKAGASEAGQKLKGQGLRPQAVISDAGLIAWLNNQEGGQKIVNPGPYVLFGTGAVKPAKPDPGTPPEVVVDVTNGIEAALYQTYRNGRGLVCYNAHDISTLAGAWVGINQYLWHANLAEDPVPPVTSDDVAQVPADQPVSCRFVS